MLIPTKFPLSPKVSSERVNAENKKGYLKDSDNLNL